MIYLSEYDLCCSILFIRGFGDVMNSYSDSFGTYLRIGKFNGKTAYKLADKEYYLFRGKFGYKKGMDTFGDAEDEVWMVILM